MFNQAFGILKKEHLLPEFVALFTGMNKLQGLG